MTTVIFHQGVLATDSRTSATSENMTCAHCDIENPKLIRDRGAKLILFKDDQVCWRGENIKMAAFCGSHAAIVKMRGLLLRFQNDGEFSRTFDILHALGVGKALEDFSALFVTDRHVYRINHEQHAPGPTKEHTHSLDDTVSLGSGGGCARAAITFMGLTPQEAVAVAMVADDPSTGGDIYWASVSDPTCRIRRIDMTPLGLELLRVGYQDILGTCPIHF